MTTKHLYWDEALEEYCDTNNIDISDIYIPQHEDAILELAESMWSEENPSCEHTSDDACYYCKMD